MNVSSVQRPKNNIEQRRQKYLGNCKICGEPMINIQDTNVIVCTNPKCKGMRSKKKSDEEINIPSFRLATEDVIEQLFR